MKIIHLVENLDLSFGGLATVVPMLVKYLEKEGIENVIGSVKLCEGETNPLLDGLKVIKAPLTLSRKIKYSKELSKLIENEITKDTIIHVHGLWAYPSYVGYKLARKHSLPLVLSTHGMIYGWCMKQSRVVKQIAMWLFQRDMLKSADVVHITEPSEEDALRTVGIDTTVALVPNGIEIDEKPAIRDETMLERIEYDSSKRYILFLGRIVHNKGLHYLISSYERLKLEEQGAEVIVAGMIEDREYFDRLSKPKGVRFVGSVDESEKRTLFDISMLFVLPSRSENFGMAIAEAMAAKLPVITTKGTPWSEIEEHDAGWWVRLTQENIDNAITGSLELSNEQLVEKGKNGYNLIQKYEWSQQARKMKNIYKRLLQ